MHVLSDKLALRKLHEWISLDARSDHFIVMEYVTGYCGSVTSGSDDKISVLQCHGF